jgi:hypothetical protein
LKRCSVFVVIFVLIIIFVPFLWGRSPTLHRSIFGSYFLG